MDQAFIRKMQQKVEQELRAKEREVVEYWKAEMQKVLGRRHQDMASLTNDVKALIDRMNKRLSVI